MIRLHFFVSVSQVTQLGYYARSRYPLCKANFEQHKRIENRMSKQQYCNLISKPPYICIFDACIVMLVTSCRQNIVKLLICNIYKFKI